jgi:hypothetical protein
MLNKMTMLSSTNIIFNIDADVLLPNDAILEAVQMLRSGYPFVYPYSGAFVHVPRTLIPKIREANSVESIKDIELVGYADHSVGGCVGFLRDKYLEIGLENEHYISHAPEDRDRELRFHLFGGYKRLPYPLFHLDHYMSEDSNYLNKWNAANFKEYEYLMSLGRDGVSAYIQTWPWLKEYKI